jgi:hypothetical protein
MSADTESKLEYFFLLPSLRCFARRYALHPDDKVMGKCLQHIVHSLNFVLGPPIREAYQNTFRNFWKKDTAESADNVQAWLNILDDEIRRIPVTTPSVYGPTNFVTGISAPIVDDPFLELGPKGQSTIVERAPKGPDHFANHFATVNEKKITPPPPAVVEKPKTIEVVAPLFTKSPESAERAAHNIAMGNKAASITDPLPTPATLNQRNRKQPPGSTAGLSAVSVETVRRKHVNPRQKAALNRLMISTHQARFSSNHSIV